ncbi:hypothetical protein BA190_26940 [Labrys sp. WJW]|uniref:hypothetical protein n=1 Tax=Labrys sp. WJW TaxID=1737983 RepID=UPI00082D4E80|nr:hypothetical protein [Labrys sp. WJW]OCC01852.1 hypothetical protein BA190_26940 [Labrys sp. WJW]
MFTSFDKAIAAFITSLVSILVLLGIYVPAFLQDPATIGSIAAIVSGIIGGITYGMPNKSPEKTSGVGTSQSAQGPPK